jgi:hypothetical protein
LKIADRNWIRPASLSIVLAPKAALKNHTEQKQNRETGERVTKQAVFGDCFYDLHGGLRKRGQYQGVRFVPAIDENFIR